MAAVAGDACTGYKVLQSHAQRLLCADCQGENADRRLRQRQRSGENTSYGYLNESGWKADRCFEILDSLNPEIQDGDIIDGIVRPVKICPQLRSRSPTWEKGKSGSSHTADENYSAIDKECLNRDSNRSTTVQKSPDYENGHHYRNLGHGANDYSITTMNATVTLTNYTNANYILIVDGDVLIWDNPGYLSHTTNIKSYEKFVDKIEDATVTQGKPNGPRPFAIISLVELFVVSNLDYKKLLIYTTCQQDFSDGDVEAECGTRALNIWNFESSVSATFCEEQRTTICAQQPGYLNPITIVDNGTLITNDANIIIVDGTAATQNVGGKYFVTHSNQVSLNGTTWATPRGWHRCLS
ncbi:GL21954 [Drosophila persimilis]|uniref:GL21954 n=1 Tax=Drosophila persimilis TaxID=7234 RepID=B4GE52_DROPE|nr:GL21954 [Drosophila persimilis]